MASIQANGLQIEYELSGKGQPLLLIMGLGAQLIYWPEGFCDALIDRGFQLIRYDSRDVGLSTKLSGASIPPVRTAMARRLLGLPLRAPYTLEDMADDAAALLTALGMEHAHVAGVSMGGMVAQTLALRHPQRVASLTSIMSHAGTRRQLIGKPRALQALLLGKPPRTREEAIARTERFYETVGSTGFPRDRKALRQRAERAYDRAFYPPGFVRHLLAILASGSRLERLPQLRMPTAVLHGAVDPLVRPEGGRATAAAIPNASFKLIAGMGHDLPAEVWPTIADSIAANAAAADG